MDNAGIAVGLKKLTVNKTFYRVAAILVAMLLVVVNGSGLGLVSHIEGYSPISAAEKPLFGPQSLPLISDDQFLYDPLASESSLREKIASVAPKLESKQAVASNDSLDLAGILIRAASDRDYDVNPYVLLSLLLASGTLNPQVKSLGDLDYALSYADPADRGVQAQLIHVSREMAQAFWARKLDPYSNQTIRFRDGRELVVEPQVNAGTYAIQSAIAQTNISYEQWSALVSGESPRFRQVYSPLAGDSSVGTAGLLAQTFAPAVAPFLRKPFNGTYAVNSWFDHEKPDYSVNGSIVIYTGERRTNAGSASCSLGISCYDGHSAIDFNTGTNPVVAAAGGTATTYRNYNFWDGCGLVNAVIINHGNGYVTKYWHLGRVDIPNGNVVEGQQIGLSGSTGCAIGPHLHFGVTLNGVAVDPYGWSGPFTDPWSAKSIWLWKSISPATPYTNPVYLPLITR